MRPIQSVPQPVIARVHALATAAGCQLVARVISRSPPRKRPSPCPVEGGWFCHTPAVAVARSIGRKRALEMGFTGEAVDARTAPDWGLVNRVVPARSSMPR